jgi:hypothetical protein
MFPDYACDLANRLSTIQNQQSQIQNRYNGQTTTFTVDLAARLTQTLDDGTHAYLYGYSRIAQVSATDMQYFLGDALGKSIKIFPGFLARQL